MTFCHTKEHLLHDIKHKSAGPVLPSLCIAYRSWIKPRIGAMPVPGPTNMTGTLGLNGKRNCDLRTYIGTVGCSDSVGRLWRSQPVATPCIWRFVSVSYSISTAVIDILSDCNYIINHQTHTAMNRFINANIYSLAKLNLKLSNHRRQPVNS